VKNKTVEEKIRQAKKSTVVEARDTKDCHLAKL